LALDLTGNEIQHITVPAKPAEACQPVIRVFLYIQMIVVGSNGVNELRKTFRMRNNLIEEYHFSRALPGNPLMTHKRYRQTVEI